MNASINLDESCVITGLNLCSNPLIDDDVDIHPDEGVLRYAVVYDSLAFEQNSAAGKEFSNRLTTSG